MPFHVTQIALLLMIWALLTVFLGKALEVFRSSPSNGWIALTAATIFSIHTVNAETMNLIASRSEELSAIALLAAFLLFQFSPKARRYHLYLVPIAIGALAKALIVVFAPLLLLYLIFIEGRSVKTIATWSAVVPSVVTGTALLVLLDRMDAPEWVQGAISRWHYLITEGFAWMHYTRLFFVPVGLTADTDLRPFDRWYEPWAIGGFAFVALLVTLIVILSRHHDLSPVAFGLSWYAVALLPTSSFYPLAEVVNEHRVFLPYMGLTLAVVFWLDKLLERHRTVFAVIALAAIVSLGLGTIVRNKAWATEESLWKDTVAKSPNNVRALMSYGSVEMARGNYAEAKRYFDRAETLDPNYSTLEINLGILEGELGAPAIAEQHFVRALSLRDDADGHYYYARWLVRAGRAGDAVPQLLLGLRANPSRTESRSLLMKLDGASGNDPEVMRLAREVLSYDPSDRIAAATLTGSEPLGRPCREYADCFRAGLEAIGSKDFLEAALANREAIHHDPSSGDAWINLGWALAQVGLDRDAERAFRRALELRPNDEHARDNLEWLAEKNQKPETRGANQKPETRNQSSKPKPEA